MESGRDVNPTRVTAGLAVLAVSAEGCGQCCLGDGGCCRRLLLGPLLLGGQRALVLLIAVALAQVVEAEVLDLVCGAARRGGIPVGLLALAFLEPEEIQLGLLLGLALCGPEPA